MPPTGPKDAITDVPGIKVGHWTNLEAATGCTVVICARGATGGVAVRGGSPSTRETDGLRAGAPVHGALLTGGSAFGLDAATGVMRWCEERGIGLEFGGARVPIVPAAVLFDLRTGRGDVRPDAAAGYAAAEAASEDAPAEGSVGAGTGATVAKLAGRRGFVKGGIGTASETAGDIVVGAIVAVNAIGEVVDSASGQVVAGPHDGRGGGFIESLQALRGRFEGTAPGENTTIGIVATNARLSGEQTNRLASVAHDGIARAVRPAHMLDDGDTLFAMATGDREVDRNELMVVEALAVAAVERAIVKAVLAATSLAGVPAVRDLSR
jgi:L-aminopeptidase/D-esterase-like protein